MTGRKSLNRARKRATKPKALQQTQNDQNVNQVQQDDLSTPPNIKKEQPAPPQVVKKILKAENDEARTLKTVFKSNPDAQMKDFIQKAAIKPQAAQIAAAKVAVKTPAESHSTAIAQELLETDDDVADNLAKLFKTSKSYKNL